MDRRKFIHHSILTGAAVSTGHIPTVIADDGKQSIVRKPVVISTWEWGLASNKAAWKILSDGGSSLDAVEQGVRVAESDPEVDSVGYGGMPDREGHVTLDASIMDKNGNAGSVAFLEGIKNPISVARLIMDKTPHVMLAGKGAQAFALANGFKKEDLLTEKAKQKWEQWIKNHPDDPYYIDQHNHDTIGMLALDNTGNLSGACTTSGLSWKYHGRVGDSPIIGAGLYVDNEVGAATATGKGESVMKICGAFLIVELMRQGKSPQEACELAIQRIAHKQKDYKDFQVGFLALSKNGETGAYSIRKNFKYARFMDTKNVLIPSDYFVK